MKMRNTQRGFTLVELLIAVVVLIVGIVAVGELVPKAISLNLDNRMDTTSTVIAQRMLDMMVNAGVNTPNLVVRPAVMVHPCGQTTTCQLGATVNDVPQGAPLTGTGVIDFTAAQVANYNFTFTDQNDPNLSQFDVRWNVTTSIRNLGVLPNVVVSKRYVVGVRRMDKATGASVTLSAWVSR